MVNAQRKPNHFCVFDKKSGEYTEIKYLSQHELSEGWQQVIPNSNKKKLMNHFSVTLAYLPEQYWKRIEKKNNKIIINGITKYTIIETNQDEFMIKLFNELSLLNPNVEILEKCLANLDNSQHSSWLVIRAKYYIKHGRKYDINYITEIS